MKKLWSVALRFGLGLKRAMTEPHSDKYNRSLLVLWTLSTVLAIGSLGLAIMIPGPLSPLWVAVNSVTASFDVTMLVWSIQGLAFRKAIRQREAEREKFYEVLLSGYTD